MGENKSYYTVIEAAELTGWTVAYINKLIKDGKVTAVKDPHVGQGGFKYQILSTEVDRMLEAKFGAVEDKKLADDNSYISIKDLAKAIHRKEQYIRDDIKDGKLELVRLTQIGTRGYRVGIPVAAAKKYAKRLKSEAPKFITAEEMENLLK